MLKLEAMRVFVSVVETGSLAAAASRIGRTPAAVSMTLKQAEAEVGGSFFDADRKVRLTPLGTTVLRNSRRALEAHDAAIDEIGRFARGEEGSLRLASTPSFARRLLPSSGAGMLEERPKLQFEVRDVDSQSVAELTAAGLVDFGIASLSSASRGLSVEFLFQDHFRLVCHRDHPLAAAGEPVGLYALASHNFIHNGLCDAIGSQGVEQLSKTARLRARNVGALYGLIEAGLGVTILPALAVPLESRLASLPLSDLNAMSRVYLMSREGEATSPVASVFKVMLRQALPTSGENASFRPGMPKRYS